VPPRPTEVEVATLEGFAGRDDQAIRVKAEPGPDGYVRLEQLAYNVRLGWYTQKSFCVPADQLRELATAIRKADCLMPRRPQHEHVDPDHPLRFPVPPPPSHDGDEAERRSS
jgi:hypothetical protein